MNEHGLVPQISFLLHFQPVGQALERHAIGENNDHQTQSITEHARKRSLEELKLRTKKRNRSLTCSNPACHNRTFADEPNLNRHLREVHGRAQYHCPVKTCERHVRGFKRRDNCLNHQKRSHGNLKGVTGAEGDDIPASRDSSVHVIEGGVGASPGESEERGFGGSMGAQGSETLMEKMDNLQALLRKKKMIEEEIARASVELQQALQT